MHKNTLCIIQICINNPIHANLYGSNLFDIIFNLQLEGYKIVLAHPERYSYYSIDDYKELVNRGVLLQINLLSLIGYYSPKVQQKTEELIRENMVDFVGTDDPPPSFLSGSPKSSYESAQEGSIELY